MFYISLSFYIVFETSSYINKKYIYSNIAINLFDKSAYDLYNAIRSNINLYNM